MANFAAQNNFTGKANICCQDNLSQKIFRHFCLVLAFVSITLITKQIFLTEKPKNEAK
jgi:hypothetical protein